MSQSHNPALLPDALYSKSQVYIRRGLRAQGDGDSEEFQLWASLALELLGKAALAKVHPALIADPQHYQSLFAACGRHISPDIKTITAKTLFERLSHLDKAFDTRRKDTCEQMCLRRNAELHSGESPFSGMPPDTWEMDFWWSSEIILSMQGESLETWLGAEDAKTPAKILKQVEKALAWSVKNRVIRCREAFESSHKNAKERKGIAEGSKKILWRDYTWDGSDRCSCPACQSFGFLGGTLWEEEVLDSEPASQGEDGEWWYPATETVRKSFSVEAFECPICKLSLYGIKEIAAAGLPSDFETEVERDRDFGPEYGND
jgi:hypothetical protein